MSALPDQAYAAALAALPRMTVRRLGVLLQHHRPPEAFAVASGRAKPSGLAATLLRDDELATLWRRSSDADLPGRLWQRCLDLDIQVLVAGDDGYPAMLLHDPAPAPVLFARGDPAVLDGRRVGIVGTRNATLSGRETAFGLGRDLAELGVHVVSGLARGIDGAAHRGVVSVAATTRAGPIAVVASGLDVVYPTEHRALWHQVAESGLLLSEAPPGTAPEAYRFPLRNRIIAALSEVLVVVESRRRGGSLITVEAARERDVTVMAVPGALRNRAAEGVNELVRDGCQVVMEAADIMMALGLDTRRSTGVAYDSRPRPTATDQLVLDACAEPATLEQLVLLTQRPLVDCAMAVARLEADGWLQQIGGWFEATSWMR